MSKKLSLIAGLCLIGFGAHAQTATCTGVQTAYGCFDTNDYQYVNIASDAGLLAQGSTTSGQNGYLVQGSVLSGAASYTAGQTQPLILSTSGNLRVQLWSGANNALQSFSGASSSSNVGFGISGIYNSTPPVLTTGQTIGAQSDTTGSLYFDTEGLKTTYSASASITLASAATDALTICGVGSKEVRIRQITLQGTATTAGALLVSLIKHSTPDSGGSSTAVTSIPNDINNAASGVTINAYTANPTPGTVVGTILQLDLPFPLLANATAPIPLSFGAPRGDQSIVLRSATDCVALNFGGATILGGAVQITNIEYTIN